MPTIIDPIDGFIREEDHPREHDWATMNHDCARCGMSMKFYMETDTPCTEKEDD